MVAIPTLVIYLALVTIVSKHLTKQFSKWQEATKRQHMKSEKGKPFQIDLPQFGALSCSTRVSQSLTSQDMTRRA